MVRLAFTSPVLTALTVTFALAQPADRPRPPTPPPNPGMSTPGMTGPGMTGPGMTGPGTNAPGALEPNGRAAPQQANLNSPDQIFLTRAIQGGLAQVELARLAEQKAGSPAVREFARRMIADHEQANRTLRALAESDGAPATDQMDAEHRNIRDALSRLSGAEFDIEYLRLSVQAHQRMATLMEYVIGSGKDAQVQRAASAGLPKVFTHLTIARQLLDQTSMQNPQVAGAPPRKVSGMPTLQTPRAIGN